MAPQTYTKPRKVKNHMQRLFNKLVIFVVIFTFYLISTGSLRMFTVFFGIIVSVMLAIVVDRVMPARAIGVRDAAKAVYLLQYLVYFTYTVMKSHIDVARLILMGKGRLRPAVVAIPYSVESDYGLAFLALSITNTPGTLALNVDKRSRILFVHWIDAASVDSREARRLISEKFEEFAKKIFG